MINGNSGLLHGLLITAQVGVGVFFTICGAHKTFHKERHQDLRETLAELHIPAPGFMVWWVAGWELIGGLGLATLWAFSGAWAYWGEKVAALALLAICLVATCTDGPRRVRAYKPLNRWDWISDWLYLPEVLYLFIIGLVLVS